MCPRPPARLPWVAAQMAADPLGGKWLASISHRLLSNSSNETRRGKGNDYALSGGRKDVISIVEIRRVYLNSGELFKYICGSADDWIESRVKFARNSGEKPPAEQKHEP